MPTMVEIIDHQKELKRKATQYYQSIESWCKYTDSGHVFSLPMNVPGNHVGDTSQDARSNRPGGMLCQKNAFTLASNYVEVANSESLDLARLDELIEFFSIEFCEYSLAVDGVPLPDQFVDVISGFTANLILFRALLVEFDAKHVSSNSAKIDLKVFFQRHYESLLELGFDPYIVTSACTQLIEAKSQHNEDGAKEVTIDLAWLNRMSSHFKNVLIYRVRSYRYEGTDRVEVPLNDDTRAALLCRALEREPANIISTFNSGFNQFHYDMHHDVLISVSSNPALFWSLAQKAHHDNFKLVLADVRECKGFPVPS